MAEWNEATLEDLLSEPIILKVMARDGVRVDEVRNLVEQAGMRTVERQAALLSQSRVPDSNCFACCR
ncbi:hypothetical protein C7441_106162 [Pseudaminobacter salicylatoxidans]|uniref:Uncharacterized protein n=1 Tax=Pseudaminobacter salicylatoxidans TaxID=93369 RepID=A0A316C5F0_PSESE|nr:hypothetical protein [Pseudaminobacter salicylatoxidans]PWJ84246.1 hypothetical protein C7441_106162 [Pseudaminobacter salicylatoxidans]